MKYSYTIKLFIDDDIWNWYDASQHSSHGFDWRNNLNDETDIKIYNQISKSKFQKKDAHEILEKYLKDKYQSQAEIITEYTNNVKKEFDKKFDTACNTLEKITGKELVLKKYKFILTTFPRCPYNLETGEIFFYITLNKFWVDPIENFLHEVLHFQFIHYWQNNPKSPVSKLSYEDFEFLKESLTVVLDNDLKPLINNADRGYPIHQEFRKELHKNWKKHHDFEKLVDFGLSVLKNYQN